ncbi:hypothetical protein B0H14DRAFT_3125339 [Mycena olivaceomarginata]|nr:hypothetical protein B0H14DRAFT_3125339 [Mycena olivaceomarginata]
MLHDISWLLCILAFSLTQSGLQPVSLPSAPLSLDFKPFTMAQFAIAAPNNFNFLKPSIVSTILAPGPPSSKLIPMFNSTPAELLLRDSSSAWGESRLLGGITISSAS